MTGSTGGGDLASAVSLAIRDLMPALRRQAWLALILTAFSIGASGFAAISVLNSTMEEGDRLEMAFVAGIVGFLLVGWIWRSTIRKREGKVMPILARAVGLDYAKDAKGFLQALPARLLPKGRHKAEDHVRGQLGAHAIQMAEVQVETGGKHSRTLFKGVVAHFPNRVAMPALFVALEDKTRPGFFFGGELSTDNLHHLRDVTGTGGRLYGIWTSWTGEEEPPALSAVVDILTRIEDHIGPGAELYAATSNGEEMHVALRHAKNLFRIGGLFPDETRLFQDVRAAMQDLTLPIALARTLIGAEATVAAKVKGA